MASNYRSAANRDSADYACLYAGCLDSDALNYDQSASLPGVCTDRILGCTDPSANNYWSEANTAAACQHSGCLDSTRQNYDPSATVSSGRCTVVFPGCTDSSGINFELDYNEDDGSCQIGGCTVLGDVNYDQAASFFDGTCTSSRRRRRQLGDAERRRLDAHTGCMSPLVSHV